MERWVDQACSAIAAWAPYPAIQDPSLTFLHRALVGLLLIAPLCSTIGIQVVNFRMAFFAEAVGHSAFTGIALGFLLASAVGDAVDPFWVMVVFGVLAALAITLYRRRSGLSNDTVIGVFSAAVIALGLCVISHLTETNRLRGGNSKLLEFLQGNILTVRPSDVLALAVFFVAAMGFQAFAYNRLLLMSINAPLAQTFGVRVRAYDYAFTLLLSLIVMFSIRAVGALLVTALLVIPAAAARNLARSAGSLFWYGLLIATTSAVGGLILSDYLTSATGGTVVLCAASWFLLSTLVAGRRRRAGASVSS